MRNRTLWLAAVLLLSMAGCGDRSPVIAEQTAEAVRFASGEAVWREAREQALLAPDGWTSLIGLHWLPLQAHYVGSSPGSGARLAMGPARLGLLKRQGQTWQLTPEASAGLVVAGEPVHARIQLHSDRAAQPTTVNFDEGKGQLQLIERGGQFALRVRHADAPVRQGFAGLQWWPAALDWVVHAQWLPHPAGRRLTVVDVIGLERPMANPGAVQFTRAGQTYRLEAIGNPDGSLLLMFADRTGGHGSYPAGRYLDVPAPSADGWVTVDFNRSINPPCAYTAFATCPLPPPENRLDLRIDAGEKAYIAKRASKETT